MIVSRERGSCAAMSERASSKAPLELEQQLESFAQLNGRSLAAFLELDDEVYQTLSGAQPQAELKPKLENALYSVGAFLDRGACLSSATQGVFTALSNRLTELTPELRQQVEQLTYLFKFNYHCPVPSQLDKHLTEVPALVREHYLNLRRLVGASKGFVNMETIETFEELIRVAHREGLIAIQARAQELAKEMHSDGQIAPGVEYIGTETNPFEASSMGPVLRTVRDYFDDPLYPGERVPGLYFTQAFCGDAIFHAHSDLGQHQAQFFVARDTEQDLFFVRWSLTEAVGSPVRPSFCSDMLRPHGYTCEFRDRTFSASQHISAVGLPKALTFLFFLAQNVKEGDFGGADNFLAEKLESLFNAIWRHDEIKRGVISADRHLDSEAFEMLRYRRETWSPQEEQILRLLLCDPYPLQTCGVSQIPSDYYRYEKATPFASTLPIAHFLHENVESLLPEGATALELRDLYFATVDVYFSCFDVQMSKWVEVSRALPGGLSEKRAVPVNLLFDPEQELALSPEESFVNVFLTGQFDQAADSVEVSRRLSFDELRAGLCRVQGYRIERGWSVVQDSALLDGFAADIFRRTGIDIL